MGAYLVNFIVYSMAMVGLLFVCLLIYKKTMLNSKCMKKNDELAIENALNLSQRKTLYVIKAGEEKFLIAADTERTTFLAKLDTQNSQSGLGVHIPTNTNNSVKPDIREQIMPVISQVKNNLYEKRQNEEEKQTLINVKPVDYSEVMASLKRNSSRKSAKGPVMREMVRKLAEPIFKDEEETV